MLNPLRLLKRERKEDKVEIIFSRTGEVVVRDKNIDYIIKNVKDLKDVTQKVKYIYNELREGEILVGNNVIWLINYKGVITVQPHSVYVKRNEFSFDVESKKNIEFIKEIFKNTRGIKIVMSEHEKKELIKEVDMAIARALYFFEKVLSQLNK